MAVLYVKEQGAYIQKQGERLVVTKKNNTLLDIPIIQVENVSAIGNVQITTQAMHMMMERGIDISYFTYSGKYIGHASADSSKNIFLRFEQYQIYLDLERRLQMARRIVDNKIQNQMAIIRNCRFQGTDYDWKADVQQMEKYRLTLPERNTSNEILGVEGICSNIYFRAFGHMLKCDISFHGRNRRPPRDPVNVIISLAYTLLTKEMCGLLEAESFEPYLGFLHGIRYGRKSLALDMIEEFRQPAIDRLVIMLFNKRMIGKYDFEFTEEGSVLLSEEGFHKFCTEYERWMTGKNSLARERSFRGCMKDQIAGLKRTICKGEAYQPYCWAERKE